MSILDDIDNELNRISETKEELRQAINDLYDFDIITEDTPFGKYAEKIKKFPDETMSLDEVFLIIMNFYENNNIHNTLNSSFSLYQGTELDLSDLNTFNIRRIDNMFSGCYNLTTLNLSNFDLTNCISFSNMFSLCTSLHTLRLDNCNNDTINKIITELPTNRITGVIKTIYCKEENAAGLTAPENWVFSLID